MSALEERPSALDAALDRAAEEAGALPSVVVDLARARVGPKVSPLTGALKRLAERDPAKAAQVYWDALDATKTIYQGDEWVEYPDFNVRLKAADAVYNRIDGTPTSRTELTGAEGGPVVLAALLASDPADLI